MHLKLLDLKRMITFTSNRSYNEQLSNIVMTGLSFANFIIFFKNMSNMLIETGPVALEENF